MRISEFPITSLYINSLNSSNVPLNALLYKVKEYSFCLALNNLHDNARIVYKSSPVFISLPFQELKNLRPEPSLSDIELLFIKKLSIVISLISSEELYPANAVQYSLSSFFI